MTIIQQQVLAKIPEVWKIWTTILLRVLKVCMNTYIHNISAVFMKIGGQVVLIWCGFSQL
jgi:hypothetical protein